LTRLKDGRYALNYNALDSNGSPLKYGGNPIEGDINGRVDSYLTDKNGIQVISDIIEQEAQKGALNPPTVWSTAIYNGMMSDAQTLRGVIKQ